MGDKYVDMLLLDDFALCSRLPILTIFENILVCYCCSKYDKENPFDKDPGTPTAD